MKPMLIAAAYVMMTSPLLPVPPLPPGAGAAPAETADLRSAVWLARADARTELAGTEFVFPLRGRGRRVAARPAALRAALAGLLSSSAGAMGKSSRRRLEVRLSSAPGWAGLELRDTGPGMSVAALAEMYGKDGPGLSAARRAVERAGGRINVSSQAGAGTTYLVEFPRAG